MTALLRTARRIAALSAVALCAAFAGCATGPSGRTTVILMPDDDGHVGAVTVASASGVQRLDRAFDAALVEAPTSAPAVQPRGEAAVATAYGELIKAQPPKPANFTLNFLLDSTTLTDESKALLKSVIEAAHVRKPTEITVFGHADATGTEKRNLKLSADRANAVAELLRKSDPSIGRIEVQFFGAKVPLVPSGPGTPEPRNRRAEISIL